MQTLNLHLIESIDHVVTPEDFEKLTMDSPALKIFTDFREFHPLVIDADVKAVEAKLLMQKSHVNLKIVLDKESVLCGVIGMDDLSNQRLVTEVSNGRAREEISVADLMVPRARMRAFDYDELEGAQVKTVVETLEQNNLQYCLVVDHQAHEIRGIISSSEVARKLSVLPHLRSEITFADIFSVLH